MLIALVTDVHGNLPALEAVLDAVLPRRPDRILSLGDQVNLGPCPREVLALLHGCGAACLSGNHERYVLSAMRGDPAFAGANFDSLRWNASVLSAEEITFPESMRICGVTFCHAVPGDDRFPVYDPQRALPLLCERFREGFTHVVCGHGHNPTHYALPHLRLDSIGAAGCMDEGAPGAAPYTMLELTEHGAVFRPYYVPFDTGRLPGLFRTSGMADFCPTVARIACTQMTIARDQLVSFVALASGISKERGEPVISPASWEAADRAFRWPDGKSTAEFWRTA